MAPAPWASTLPTDTYYFACFTRHATRHQASGIRHQASGIRHQASG